MRDETKIDFYASAQGREYDEACRRLFKNREILAPILQMVVPEYEGCTVEEVMRYIEADTIGDVPVEDLPVSVEGLPTELSSVTEKLIRYDVHFKSVNPRLSDAKLCVHLHINLELQNDYRPGRPAYPVIKRALYYAARELSAQLGRLTETADYAALEKVYSIWICNRNVPPELRDTATGYSVKREDLIGICEEPEADFDLLNVILIRRGGESREKIFDFLRAVFAGEIEKMEEYTNVESNPTIRQEVEHMTGLGAGIYEEGLEQGIKQGKEQGIERGRKQEARMMAEKLFRAGADYHMVEECTGSLDAVELRELYEGVLREKKSTKTRNIRR